MRGNAADVPELEYEYAPSPALPADHVLNSGSVLFPGSFDQNGCPLIIFPVDAQAKLSSELTKAEVADFINYFLCLHNKKQEGDSLVSVVADLRQASLPTTKFITETILLLEDKRMVHSVYVLQPKKKDAAKLLQKRLYHSASFKKVYMKEIPELFNYIDRSQLTVSLGGYLIYCHQSWVSFIKDINGFLQEFLSVVPKLPLCISTLQSLSKLPLPTTLSGLQRFCSTNEDKFQQLKRELGLDDLLRHCESVVEKLHYPEKDSSYQAMAGTVLFIHTTFDMLQNHSRITAAVEKLELLWQQAFSQARLQLQVLQLREDALQITDQIKVLFHKRPYKLEIAKDAEKAAVLLSHFKESTHTPAMALVRCAEDVVHTMAEFLPVNSLNREHWVSDLEKLKDKLQSTMHFTLQTLRAVSNYHHYFNKASAWYSQILSENLLQELLSGVNTDNVATQHQRRTWGTVSVWRHKLSTFLKNHHPPDVEELIYLAHLSNVIPDDVVQQAGKQMSQRCLTLRKLLISPGPVTVEALQLALQWQYELLRSHHACQFSGTAAEGTAQDVRHGPSKSNLMNSYDEAAHCLRTSPSTAIIQVSVEGKPHFLSSFESSFNGAGREEVEDPNPLSRSTGTRDSERPIATHVSGVSDPEFGCGSLGSASRSSIQIIPKVSEESLNVEIKVKRSAALPTNPWLSFSLDNVENMYTVTITHNHTPQKTDLQTHDLSYPCPNNYFRMSHNLSSKVEILSSMQPRGPQSRDWILHSQNSLDDTILSPISHILSSTITDGRNKSTSATEGNPTLIWDSYDLHEHGHIHSVIDISWKDWDEKEQERLREVEVLCRTDEILEEEENVLEQEAVLQALLTSDVRNSPWPTWDSEDQLGVISSNELTEAGLSSLIDHLDPAESVNCSEPRTTGSASKTWASEDYRHYAEKTGKADTTVISIIPDLLMELRTVHILDELIIEENLKIQARQSFEGNPGDRPSENKPTNTNRQLCVSNEREALLLQLKKEKSTIKKLENSLHHECKGTNYKHQERKFVRCSIMGKAETEDKEGQALCAEFLSESCNRLLRTHSAIVDQNEDACIDENVLLLPVDTKEAIPHIGVPQCLHLTPSKEPPFGCNTSTFNDPCYLKQSSQEGIKCQACVCREDNDNGAKYKPESSLTSEMRPDDEAFDPGGEALPSVNGNLIEHESSRFREPLNPVLPPAAQDPGFVKSKNVILAASLYSLKAGVIQNSNNDGNHVQVCRLSLDHSSASLIAISEDTTEEMMDNQSVFPPDKYPNKQSNDRELNEHFPDRIQSPDALRILCSETLGMQSLLTTERAEMMAFKMLIVLDTGCGLMKAGFTDQNHPNIVIPTIIGTPKYEEVINGHIKRETHMGHEAQYMRGILALQHPIKNGIIRHWDEMEKIWHHTFKQLHVDPEDHPVLPTEVAMNTLKNQQHMVEIMFECFNVPLNYVALQALLALYASGRSTVSHSVPVFEQYALPCAEKHFPLAGTDVTMHFKKLLQEQGVCMRTTAEMEIVREMKEQCCCVSLDYEADLAQGGRPARRCITPRLMDKLLASAQSGSGNCLPHSS